MSLFSHDKLSQPSTVTNANASITPDRHTAVRTMRDDLDAIEQPASASFSNDTQAPHAAATINRPESPFATPTPSTSIIDTEPKKPDFSQELYADRASTPFPTIAVAAFAIVIVLGGGYVFFRSQSSPTVETVTNETSDAASEPAPSRDIFSAETPNYLPIDTQLTQALAQETLLQTAKRVAALDDHTKPVEFIVTDKNNLPLSFAEFAALSGITISPIVLSTFSDTFSLFIFTENDTPHIGISIDTPDEQTSRNALRQKEPYLVQDLSALFLGDTPTKTSETFQDNFYNGGAVRFINIHPETLLSIDYAITDGHVVIGTSRQTHRAILDTLQ
jgi:hypothetical protein